MADIDSRPITSSPQSDASLSNESFSAEARNAYRSTRAFTKLVDRLPYIGDAIIQNRLRKIFVAESPEELKKATSNLVRSYSMLQSIHIGLILISLHEGWKDSGAALRGDAVSALEAGFTLTFAAVLTSVAASQTILLRRMVERTHRILESEPSELKPQKLKFAKPASLLRASIALAALSLNGYLLDGGRTDSEAPPPAAVNRNVQADPPIPIQKAK